MLPVKLNPETERRRALGKIYALLVRLADTETQTSSKDMIVDGATEATPGRSKDAALGHMHHNTRASKKKGDSGQKYKFLQEKLNKTADGDHLGKETPSAEEDSNSGRKESNHE